MCKHHSCYIDRVQQYIWEAVQIHLLRHEAVTAISGMVLPDYHACIHMCATQIIETEPLILAQSYPDCSTS